MSGADLVLRDALALLRDVGFELDEVAMPKERQRRIQRKITAASELIGRAVKMARDETRVKT
jgi:hypothetical protein